MQNNIPLTTILNMQNYSYFVYIIQCSDNSFYTGVTNDLDRRIYEHNNSDNTKAYTYSRKPVKLVYSAEFENINDAISWEKQIKGWSKNKKLALIKGDWKSIKELSECTNNTHHTNAKHTLRLRSV